MLISKIANFKNTIKENTENIIGFTNFSLQCLLFPKDRRHKKIKVADPTSCLSERKANVRPAIK